MKNDTKRRNLVLEDTQNKDKWRRRCRQLVDHDDSRCRPGLKWRMKMDKILLRTESSKVYCYIVGDRFTGAFFVYANLYFILFLHSVLYNSIYFNNFNKNNLLLKNII